MNRQVDFAMISAVALSNAELVCRWLLPNGKVSGSEYVAINPHRDDKRLGSFKINLRTGRWADFAVGNARGGDLISLVAWRCRLSQAQAARLLASFLSIEPGRHA